MGKSRLPITILSDKSLAISEIIRLEVYGYHLISSKEEIELNRFFQHIRCQPISKDIIDKTIIYRQTKNTSMGDAIIAATAFVYNLLLFTANTDDFFHFSELQIINPFIDL